MKILSFLFFSFLFAAVGVRKERDNGENLHGTGDCHHGPEPFGGDCVLWGKNKEVCVLFNFSLEMYFTIFHNDFK